ncbi:helix-turn-helix domain-containing protein [Arthrobacter sp. BPSS-3]|uniref:helix-turn-helix domain-containing protein n=1 Tax=Arthrobacter sp. BPSS-3 TaxID=3366580 RepID=UPI0037DC6EC5
MANSSQLLHPVRLRIVQALLGEEGLTTHAIRERIPDVPVATLYRHIAILARHGLIDVVVEEQIRGAIERTYRIAPGVANPTADELMSLSSEELLTVFTVFSTGLIRDFGAYVHGAPPDLPADRVNFAQADFWATPEEVDTLLQTVLKELVSLRSNGPGGGRRKHKLTTVLLPVPPTDGGAPE